MPYIKPEDYDRAHVAPEVAGELNYAISMLMIEYLERNGVNYQNMNDCMGACEGAKAEFYRRVAAPYEDTKIISNGDMYPESVLTQ